MGTEVSEKINMIMREAPKQSFPSLISNPGDVTCCQCIIAANSAPPLSLSRRDLLPCVGLRVPRLNPMGRSWHGRDGGAGRPLCALCALCACDSGQVWPRARPASAAPAPCPSSPVCAHPHPFPSAGHGQGFAVISLPYRRLSMGSPSIKHR